MANKIKVLYLINSLERGGAERQMVELAKNLDRSKYTPIVVFYNYCVSPKQNELISMGVDVHYIKKRFKVDPLFLFNLVRFIKSQKIDIIHSFLEGPNFWARVAANLAGHKVVVTSKRDTYCPYFHMAKLRAFISKLIYRFSNCIIANSKSAQKILVEEMGVRAQKVKVIYNGIDFEKFSTVKKSAIVKLKEELGLKREEFIIGLIGSISPQKNHICFLKALAHVKSILGDKQKIKALFIGNENPKFKRKLVNFIRDNDLQDLCLFLGPRDDIPVIMNSIDVLVLPSLYEGFPNVILEAWAAGKPVIASDVSDLPLIIENGQDGYVFKCNDHKELAKKLIKIVEISNEERAAIGKRGRQKVMRKFTIKRMVEETEKIYEELLG